MKKTILFILLNVSALVLKAQHPAEEKQAIAMLRTFYNAYLNELDTAKDLKKSEKRLIALQTKYCTTHLRNAIAKRNNPDKDDWLDYDPFTNAQDGNPNWLKTLSIKRSLNRPNMYTVSYYYIDDINKKKVTTIIYLIVTKMSEGYKISSIYLSNNDKL